MAASKNVELLSEKKPIQPGPISVIQKESVPINEVEQMHDILKDLMNDENFVNFPQSPVAKNIEQKYIAA